MKQMVMIVPINTNVNKTQDIADNLWQQGFQRSKSIAFRWPQFKNHNGNDDGKNSITESK
jgi:hypothetical protein